MEVPILTELADMIKWKKRMREIYRACNCANCALCKSDLTCKASIYSPEKMCFNPYYNMTCSFWSPMISRKFKKLW